MVPSVSLFLFLNRLLSVVEASLIEHCGRNPSRQTAKAENSFHLLWFSSETSMASAVHTEQQVIYKMFNSN